MPVPKEIGQEHCPGKFHTSVPKYKENEINGIYIDLLLDEDIL